MAVALSLKLIGLSDQTILATSLVFLVVRHAA